MRPASRSGTGCQYRPGQPDRRLRSSRVPVPGILPGLLLAWPQCLLVNRGSQQPETIVLAGIGLLLLYAGLRFLLARLDASADSDEPVAPAWLRFLGGVFAGLLIFLA